MDGTIGEENMNTYCYETDATKQPVQFRASSDDEAIQTATRFASLRGDKLLLVYNEAQDIMFCAE
jgi:hypothetical protein